MFKGLLHFPPPKNMAISIDFPSPVPHTQTNEKKKKNLSITVFPCFLFSMNFFFRRPTSCPETKTQTRHKQTALMWKSTERAHRTAKNPWHLKNIHRFSAIITQTAPALSVEAHRITSKHATATTRKTFTIKDRDDRAEVVSEAGNVAPPIGRRSSMVKGRKRPARRLRIRWIRQSRKSSMKVSLRRFFEKSLIGKGNFISKIWLELVYVGENCW